MEKLKVLTFIFLSTFMLSSCSTVRWASIKNATHEDIIVKAFFENNNERSDSKIPIAAGEVNVWQYDRGFFETSKIDSRLSYLEVSNSAGCLLRLSRADIDKQAEVHLQQIIITPEDFLAACAK